MPTGGVTEHFDKQVRRYPCPRCDRYDLPFEAEAAIPDIAKTSMQMPGVVAALYLKCL